MRVRLPATLALVTLGWPAPVALGEVPAEAATEGAPAVTLTEADWLVRTARIEGASANVREAARAVKRTADAIGQAGRLVELARLDGEAATLEKKFVGLDLAADVLDEPIGR